VYNINTPGILRADTGIRLLPSMNKVETARSDAPATSRPKLLSSHAPHYRRPVLKLVVLFLGWKALLLTIAYASPGPGYDTSTELAFHQQGHNQNSSWLGLVLQRLLLKTTRWDAIYFSFNSAQGHVYEQNWAFSWAFARASSALANGVSMLSS